MKSKIYLNLLFLLMLVFSFSFAHSFAKRVSAEKFRCQRLLSCSTLNCLHKAERFCNMACKVLGGCKEVWMIYGYCDEIRHCEQKYMYSCKNGGNNYGYYSCSGYTIECPVPPKSIDSWIMASWYNFSLPRLLSLLQPGK